MGLFEHFPYTNFHDLNLDVILNRVKTAEASAIEAAEDAAGSTAQAEAAVSTANAANTTAQQALNTATSANTAAQQAISDAAAALAAAETSEYEIITINCNSEDHTATVESDYTWEELFNLVIQNKVLFRLADSNFASSFLSTPFRPNVFPSPQTPHINAEIQVDGFYMSGPDALTNVHFQHVWFMNSLTGRYRLGTVSITDI